MKKSFQGCAEFHRNVRVSRRGFLRAGALGASGLTLPELIRSDALAGPAAPKDHSVIILWMRGGPSQHETWDPKPEAPVEYRGAFGSMETTVPGIRICDMLPQCASVMDKWSIIRSLHHNQPGHSAGDQVVFTGYDPGPDPTMNIHPSCGSIASEQLGGSRPDLPTYLMVPRQVPGTDSAYLGPAHKPFETIVDPATRGTFTLKNFSRLEEVSEERFSRRRTLLGQVDRLEAEQVGSSELDALDDFQQQAYGILSSDRARRAFDLDSEPAALRERYGFVDKYNPMDPRRCSASAFNQRLLLARRLVEAGVRLVTVDCRWWDTHVEGIDSMKNGFLPRWDQSYSALIEDLDQRGLLDTTMVLAWGEFGRTPRVNKDNGRDHYPNVFSAAITGGGIQGGRVIGSSDSKGAFPLSHPVTPQDVLATLYRHLGVDVDKHYLDHGGRPVATLASGTPILELF
ncbi:MAG: DUF1501 domain-containing protein [Planctomycetota bacterium]|nr:DUF1501 domain-containing protein [Planctomycetota bacterium]